MGSSPDGVAVPAQPLRDFLATVGEAVTNVNTAIIGLDAVEQGYQKPSSLNISWNPADRVAAARKSRKFVLEAALVRVAEALLEFIRVTAKMPRFGVVRSTWDENTSGAEKLSDIATAALGRETYNIAGAALLLHWRNRVVHSNSKASLAPRHLQLLRKASNEIEAEFSRLSVERLLKDFEAGQPTLKDISSLISMSIRMARAVDRAVGQLTSEDLNLFLDLYGLNARIAKIEAETTPEKRQASVLRMIQSITPGLTGAYRRLRLLSGEGEASPKHDS